MEKLGKNPWYPAGAAFALVAQGGDGSWSTYSSDKPDELSWNTCFAILFLKRATRPLVASEDIKK